MLGRKTISNTEEVVLQVCVKELYFFSFCNYAVKSMSHCGSSSPSLFPLLYLPITIPLLSSSFSFLLLPPLFCPSSTLLSFRLLSHFLLTAFSFSLIPFSFSYRPFFFSASQQKPRFSLGTCSTTPLTLDLQESLSRAWTTDTLQGFLASILLF